MSWIEKVKIGDKVRYLGGDIANKHSLVEGEEYLVSKISGDRVFIHIKDGFSWGIGSYNDNCFELIESVSPKTPEDLIASLAQTVTQLERELNELKYKYEIDREMFIDDIAMIDERTQPAEANLVRKTVTYDYE